ncbi:MAG: WG repeat-containing protein [Prolixibacteraceae bacterium]|nr:WG repeat-containing protein [Prolixibacteraceae bacterium]
MANGKCGFINTDGNYIINPQFEYATRFFGDIAFISIDDKYGIIDKKGKIIVNPQFNNVLMLPAKNSQMVENNYFDINTLVEHMAKLITENSVDCLNFETPITEVIKRYKMGEEKFNELTNRSNNFDLILTGEENISNYAFLVFKIEVNNYNKNPKLNHYGLKIHRFKRKEK